MKRVALILPVFCLLAAVACGDGFDVASRYRATFTKPPVKIPSNSSVDAPLLGNGDMLVALGGKSATPRFYIGKNDLWVIRSGGARPQPLARLDLDVPSLAGASYHVEQTLGDATTVAVFEKDGLRLNMRCWVAATEPLLVIELSAKGGDIPVASSLHVGGASEPTMGSLRHANHRVSLGREQYSGGRWYLDGLLDEVQVYDRSLSPKQIAELKEGGAVSAKPVRHWSFDEEKGEGDGQIVEANHVDGVKGKALKLNGRSSHVDCPPLNAHKAVTVSAFVYLHQGNATQYILSQGEWNKGWSLGLSSGKLRMAVGSNFAQTTRPVPVNRWVHVAGVFDGSRIYVYVDGQQEVRKAHEGLHREAGSISWVDRRIDEGVLVPAAAACAYRVVGWRDPTFAVTPGRPVTLVAAVDSLFNHENFTGRVVKVVSDLSERSGLPDIRRAHLAWWEDYWNKSYVEIADKFLEQRYYLSLYGMGSASRNPDFPPGIFGWVTTDTPAWNGDYHMNYNHVSPFYGLGVANRIEQLDPCIQPILDSEQACRALAKSKLGVDGLLMSTGMGPKGGMGYGDHGHRSNASYSCVPINERWQTTRDPAFARKAYPFVRGVAEFWENWLKWEPFDSAQGRPSRVAPLSDVSRRSVAKTEGRLPSEREATQEAGRYVIYKDAVHEGSGEDMNPIVSLAFVRMVMNLALDMSEELDRDADQREKWRHIRDHMSEYPTCRLGDLQKWWPAHLPRTDKNRNLPIFRYTEKGTEWWRNNTVGIQHIFPGGGIGLDSDPDLLERGRNQVMVMKRWIDMNGMNSIYAAAIRVGYDPEIILRELKSMQQKIGGANGMITGNPHGIEEFSIVPNAIQEMLMQSHEGVVRLFPVWPKGQDARFGTLRARGAFLVSGEMTDGYVANVTIVSEKGRDCTVQNPWPGESVRVVRNGKPAEWVKGERFSIETAVNETLGLRPPAKPNVLFLFTDDQRADTIAALGNPIIKTPHLDRLCRNGVAFTRAYMQGSFSGATCIPSRAMLLAGQSLFHVDNRLLRDETWPAAFGRAGYRTQLIGKWHNGSKSIPACFQSAHCVRIKGYTKAAPLDIEVSDLLNGQMTPPRWTRQHAAAAFADRVVRFLSEDKKDRPFFCYVPFDGPHDPHIVPEDFPVRYDPDRIPLPVNFLPEHPFDNGELRVRDEVLLPHPRPPAAVRQMIADYYRYISYLDMQIGRILDALAESPYATNTIVAFAGDSGVARGGHGLIGKQNLYEYDGVRVPLIVTGPGILAGKTTEAMCYLYDVLPTLGAVCGVPAPPKSEGLDLSAVLRDPSRPGRSDLVFAYKSVQRAIATKNWKLIRYPRVDETQLFSLQADPYEIQNLAGDSQYAARVAELVALLQRRLDEAGDAE